METKCDNDRVDLGIVSMISLLLIVSLICRIGNKITTCLTTTGQEIDHFLNGPSTMHIE